MNMPTKLAKDDIRTPLVALLREYMIRCGTNMEGAIRDLLTETYHICERRKLEGLSRGFEERMAAARAVIAEELAVEEPELFLTLTLDECKKMGKHLTSCDASGFCNYCGEQAGGD